MVQERLDLNLEEKNFMPPGEAVAPIWGEMTIDGHPVVARYIAPKSPEPASIELP